MVKIIKKYDLTELNGKIDVITEVGVKGSDLSIKFDNHTVAWLFSSVIGNLYETNIDIALDVAKITWWAYLKDDNRISIGHLLDFVYKYYWIFKELDMGSNSILTQFYDVGENYEEYINLELIHRGLAILFIDKKVTNLEDKFLNGTKINIGKEVIYHFEDWLEEQGFSFTTNWTKEYGYPEGFSDKEIEYFDYIVKCYEEEIDYLDYIDWLKA